MTLSLGSDGYLAYSSETTYGTRVAPAKSLPFRSESMQDSGSQPIWRRGIIKGRRLHHGHGTTRSDVGGQISFDLTAESVGGLFKAAMGAVSTTGAGPYAHEFTRGLLTSSSFSMQIGWEDDAATDFRKDYIGCIVDGWTLDVQADQDPSFTMDLKALSEEVDSYTAVTPSYASFTYFEFSDATVNFDAGGTECFETLSISGRNNLEANNQICPTTPTATTYRDSGFTEITGTLGIEFDGTWTKYNKFRAGTEATLQVILNAGASAILQFDMNIVFLGETPMISGPEVIRQGVPFAVTSGTDDATACTITLTNGDATP